MNKQPVRYNYNKSKQREYFLLRNITDKINETTTTTTTAITQQRHSSDDSMCQSFQWKWESVWEFGMNGYYAVLDC